MEESQLKLYSLGIVLKDKTPLDDFIEVCPIEQFNIQESGLIDEKEKVSKSNLKDSNNKGFDTEVKSKNSVKAKWISFGVSNRITAPDVYKNETVILFKFADANEYYWTTIFREPSIRRQETVLYAFSNKKSGLDKFDNESSYWFFVDTRKKKIQIHTSNNDGEHTTYDIILNTEKGTLTITDGKNNNIVLNSPEDTLNVNTNNKVNINCTNECNVTSTIVNIRASNVCNIISPTINLQGNVNISGNLSTAGNSQTSGNVSINGKLTVPLTETYVEGRCSG